MSSVALVGPDGAGKTTVARRLEAEPGLKVRYLYMGVSIDSSNVTLPTTRWAQRVKEVLAERIGGGSSGADARDARAAGGQAPADDGLPKGRLWATARLLNRIAEEWYRQLLAWWYQLRGYVVVYDRHFVFDFRGSDVEARNRTLDRRLHRWHLVHLYPRPDLVICLDAPGEVLFARKGEKSPEALEARRQAFLRQGERLEGFVRVDATRSPEEVYAEVLRHVRSLSGEAVSRRRPGPPSPPGRRPRAPSGAGRADG